MSLFASSPLPQFLSFFFDFSLDVTQSSPSEENKYLSRESGEEKTKVRPDCPSAPTQLALCLRLAYIDF
jgi:hypothetical protein